MSSARVGKAAASTSSSSPPTWTRRRPSTPPSPPTATSSKTDAPPSPSPPATSTSLVLEVNPDNLVVPAHAWTPWYGIYGSKSGFNSLVEAFGDLTDCIPAIETGLSSDPSMNWPIPELTNKAIVSFSDAHSLPKLGRELTVFTGQPDYQGLSDGLWHNRVSYTVELYPEEGKYHYDGHRKCGVSWHPEESTRHGGRCPVCRRPLTLGVLHRALALAEGVSFESAIPAPEGGSDLPAGLVHSATGRPPFARIVPPP